MFAGEHLSRLTRYKNSRLTLSNTAYNMTLGGPFSGRFILLPCRDAAISAVDEGRPTSRVSWYGIDDNDELDQQVVYFNKASPPCSVYYASAAQRMSNRLKDIEARLAKKLSSVASTSGGVQDRAYGNRRSGVLRQRPAGTTEAASSSAYMSQSNGACPEKGDVQSMRTDPPQPSKTELFLARAKSRLPTPMKGRTDGATPAAGQSNAQASTQDIFLHREPFASRARCRPAWAGVRRSKGPATKSMCADETRDGA